MLNNTGHHGNANQHHITYLTKMTKIKKSDNIKCW